MKHFVRSVKYCIYLAVILCLVIADLSVAGWVGNSVESVFRNGWRSIGQIGLILAAFSAIYPLFGFGSRELIMPGAYDEVRPVVLAFMEGRGYRLEREEGENLYFRLRNPLNRLTRMFEDRISFTRGITGFSVEGPSKDVVRVLSGLDRREV